MKYFTENDNKKFSATVAFGVITVIWLIAFFIVKPFGEFPLNDDWAYSKNVFYLIEEGILKFTNWPAMTLIFHMISGAAFCKIFGFSFTILRISTIIISLIGLFFIYLIVNKTTKNNKISLFSALLIAFNPLYFSLSFTFMTDIPFITWSLIAVYFYLNYLNKSKLHYITLATIFSIFAILIRQTGILIPSVFFIIYIYKNSKNFFLVFFSTFLVIASLIIFQYYLKYSTKLPDSYASANSLFEKFNFLKFASKSVLRLKTLFLYTGLFLLPILLFQFSEIWKNLTKKQKIIRTSISSIIFPLTLFNPFPTGNILYNFGLGPKLLKDGYFDVNISPALPEFVFIILKIAGSVGAILLVFYIISLLKNKNNITKEKFIFFLILIIGGYLFYFSLDKYSFDRYYLFAQIFILLLITHLPAKTNKITGIISTLFFSIFLIFSISATHDYFSWNKARWEILNELEAQGISPENIDGGFEYNGWHQTAERSNIQDINQKSWWFVKNDDYVVSFGKIDGFEIIKLKKYKTIIPTKNNNIYLLKKIK